jgi:DnaJ-like protein
MTYYDELGLAPTASTEEIRRAHRNLSRILHPDLHPEGELRQLAESQMRRLNEVCEILSDPVRRHVYDASLAGAPAPVNRWKAPRLRGDLWTLAAIAVVLLIGGYGIGAGDHDQAERAAASPVPSVAEPVRPATRPKADARPLATPVKSNVEERVTQLRSQVEALRAERDEALARAAQAAASVHVESKPAVAVAQASAVAAETAAPAETARGFAGTWYYPQPSEAAPSALYPPEFIEVTIVETGGAVQGRYRARYRVRNRALSPDVAFRFEGRRGESSAEVPWRSPGGASGELRLRLIADGKMEAAWSAAALGELGLSAGTAVLVRRR